MSDENPFMLQNGQRFNDLIQKDVQNIRSVALQTKRLNEKFEKISKKFVFRQNYWIQMIVQITHWLVSITVSTLERVTEYRTKLRNLEKLIEERRTKLVELSEIEVVIHLKFYFQTVQCNVKFCHFLIGSYPTADQ